MNYTFDVLILGGGASGLMCAIAAKKHRPKLNIAIIEKNDRVGKKLLATGNGRCNLTNLHLSPERYVGSFHVKPLLERYDATFLRKELEKIGLLTFADKEGRVYPVSRQASSVLDVLRFACERQHINLFLSEQVRSVRREHNGFIIKTEQHAFYGDKLVIACGSKAAPKLGGSAAGTDYLRNFGLSVEPFQPALCPVGVRSEVLKSLKGLRAAGAVSLCRNNKIIKTESGEVQFADGALSGICLFNLSLYAKKGDILHIDLLSDISEKNLFAILKKNKELFAKQSSDNLLTGILSKRLAQAVMKLSGIPDFSHFCMDLTEMQLIQIAKKVKHMPFFVTQTCGFDQAQSARGGLKGSELNKMMESKKIKHLYVCGEAIDICGECGGFNLHVAFTGGILVGEQL